MNFKYVYQKVVDLRTNEKSQAEWILSAAVGELEAQKRSLEQLLADRVLTWSAIQQEVETKAEVAKLQQLQRHMDFLEKCIITKNNEVRYAEVNVETKQKQLNSKVLDEKVWLKAREKANASFQHELLLREQSDLDEMATVRFAMRAH